MNLRPYQLDLLSKLRAAIRGGSRAPLVVAPCGAGKTVLFSYIAAHAGGRVAILAHRRELLDQISQTLAKFHVKHTMDTKGKERVLVASVQTVASRLDSMTAPSLVIIDEAHHATSPTYRAILARWSHATAIGVTASPARLDGTGLGDVFDSMTIGPSVRELTDMGALVPYRIFAPSRPDLTGVRTTAGDYNKGDLVAAVDKPTITGNAVAHYTKLAAGKRAVAFCTSVEHAKHTALAFQAAGYQAAWLDGGMAPGERKRTVDLFRAGRIQVVTSCDLISEGFDLPAIEVAVMLRPTQSTVLWIQQSGRALRPMEGKAEALILDHAGNVFQHGLPDADRSWSLEGRKRTKRDARESEVHVRVCPACFGAQEAKATRCVFCGAEFPPKPRTVEEVRGELAEIKLAERKAARVEVGKARNLADLVAIGQKRGYASPYGWARNLMAARGKR